MASGKPRSWAWQWFTKVENGIQCNLCTPGEKIYKETKVTTDMKIHLRTKHEIFNDEDEKKWIERTEEFYSIWKHFTKQETYSAKCKFCPTVIQHANRLKNIQIHLERKHENVIKNERQEVVKNIWLSQHFVIDENNSTAECKRTECKGKFSIFIGIENLTNHTCQHENENITNHTNMERNSMDMIQQSTSEENNANTSSYQAGTHSEAAENLEGEQSYRVDVMEPGRTCVRRDNINWAWQHYTKIKSNIHCNHCTKIYRSGRMITEMKIHLRKNHKIFNDEDERIWKERTEENYLIWKHFTKQENYSAKCKNCATVIQHAHNVFSVHYHLKLKHQNIIKNERQEVVENIWLSQHFVIDENNDTAECNYCNKKFAISRGIENLKLHTSQHRDKILKIHTNMGSNSIDMIQQSTSEENNANTSSYQAGTHSEAAENLEGEQSYHVDIMEPGRTCVRRENINWAWQHYTKIGSNIHCNHCTNIYSSVSMLREMKIHLRKKHKIFNDEDERRWIKQTEEYYLIWKHFKKQENYSAKCNFCANVIQHAHRLRSVQKHLELKHENVIKNERQEVVKNIWLSLHFVIDEKTEKAECNYCNKKFTIFRGIEFLSKHTCKHKNKNITSHTNMGRNNIDMILQSTSEENNPNTSSYQPGTYSEAAENLEGEWSSTSANIDDHIATATKIYSEDVCNTDNEKRNEMEWRERKEESHSTWKYFTKGENYSAKCQICNNVIPNAYIPLIILKHLKTMHVEEIAKEKRKVMENTWLSQHFKFDVKTEEAICICCTKMLSIFLGIENLKLHTCKHRNENLKNRTNMGRNSIDMIQQSTSEENNPNTSSYQAGTHSETAENLEGDRSSISANYGDEDLTEMDFEYIFAVDDPLLI